MTILYLSRWFFIWADNEWLKYSNSVKYKDIFKWIQVSPRWQLSVNIPLSGELTRFELGSSERRILSSILPIKNIRRKESDNLTFFADIISRYSFLPFPDGSEIPVVHQLANSSPIYSFIEQREMVNQGGYHIQCRYKIVVIFCFRRQDIIIQYQINFGLLHCWKISAKIDCSILRIILSATAERIYIFQPTSQSRKM